VPAAYYICRKTEHDRAEAIINFVENLSATLMGEKSRPFPFLEEVCFFLSGLFNSPPMYLA